MRRPIASRLGKAQKKGCIKCGSGRSGIRQKEEMSKQWMRQPLGVSGAQIALGEAVLQILALQPVAVNRGEGIAKARLVVELGGE